jgi:hypothetical protein
MTIKALYPSIEPSLNLDFANTKRLDPRITFTRASTGTYVGDNGLVKTAAVNEARFEHTLAGESLGLLVEEARTNIALHNRDLSNVAWTATNVTAVKDQTGADGVASSASKITASADNGTILQAITATAATRTTSAYVKRITGSGTVELTQNGGTTWTAVTVTNSWTRVNLVAAAVTNPSVGFRLGTNGDSIAVDYVQCESSAGVTSVIETGGASVTRAADVTVITGSNFTNWYNQNEGVFAAELLFPGGVTGSSFSFFGVSAGVIGSSLTSGNGIKYGNGSPPTSTRVYVITGGVTVFDSNSTINPRKVAIAYKQDDFAISRSTTLAVDTSGGVPLGMDRFTFRGFGSITYGRFSYYPVRLSNAILQSITV